AVIDRTRSNQVAGDTGKVVLDSGSNNGQSRVIVANTTYSVKSRGGGKVLNLFLTNNGRNIRFGAFHNGSFSHHRDDLFCRAYYEIEIDIAFFTDLDLDSFIDGGRIVIGLNADI